MSGIRLGKGMPGSARVSFPGERPGAGQDKPRDGKPLVEHRVNRTIRRLAAKMRRKAGR